jgi:hypothetical protein
MTERRFEQGQLVSWKDASGQRYRGRVVQYQPPHVDERTGTSAGEAVLVVVDGTSHVSLVPPADLTSEGAPRVGRKPPSA